MGVDQAAAVSRCGAGPAVGRVAFRARQQGMPAGPMRSREVSMDAVERARKANGVTLLGSGVNLALMGIKLAVGIVGRSQAMVADAIHTGSDFATDVVVLVSTGAAKKPIDEDHPYGHGKYETLAALVIGVALCAVGLGLGWEGGSTAWAVLFADRVLAPPHWVALVGAVLSIVAKEWLYRITVKVGRELEAPAVVANAWHHRSDALSSVGTLVGIGGAVALGGVWTILDPLAAAVVAVMIVKVGVEVIAGAGSDLIETALAPAVLEEIRGLALGVPGVSDPHKIRTRRVGPRMVMDLHVRVDPGMRVADAHGIASRVEALMRERWGGLTLCTVHVEPLREASGGTAGSGVGSESDSVAGVTAGNPADRRG